MPQSYTCLIYHIVFSTKDRRPQITIDLQPRLYSYIGGIIDDKKGRLLAAGGVEDHIHLLISLHQQTSISEVLRLVKANSSKWVHEQFPGMSKFAWQDGYGAFSVSQSNVEAVKRYIADQKRHHERMSFREEFVMLLERHGVPFEERYLCA